MNESHEKIREAMTRSVEEARARLEQRKRHAEATARDAVDELYEDVVRLGSKLDALGDDEDEGPLRTEIDAVLSRIQSLDASTPAGGAPNDDALEPAPRPY